MNGSSIEKALVSADGLTLLQDASRPVTWFKRPTKKGESWVTPPNKDDPAVVTFKITFAGE